MKRIKFDYRVMVTAIDADTNTWFGAWLRDELWGWRVA